MCFTTGIWQIQITQILANRRHCIDRHSKKSSFSVSLSAVHFFSLYFKAHNSAAFLKQESIVLFRPFFRLFSPLSLHQASRNSSCPCGHFLQNLSSVHVLTDRLLERNRCFNNNFFVKSVICNLHTFKNNFSGKSVICNLQSTTFL